MTQAMEDYLKTVSILASENGGEARLTDIASRLGVSKPSAFTALKVLEGRGLVEHRRYRTVRLTKAGHTAAAEIRGRYALMLTFLTTIIGVSAVTAEKDACLLEHCLSAETLGRIRALALD
ncbi:MAG: metal-dependent transcriptional regulator [Treponema sp.]|jgi:DtxR family Mn-dependent transcriptional regulator|nr:metal-dependent transcriptional regulator [Treponema sp.]